MDEIHFIFGLEGADPSDVVRGGGWELQKVISASSLSNFPPGTIDWGTQLPQTWTGSGWKHAVQQNLW